MKGDNWNWMRHWSGRTFSFDSRFGAYGTANKVQGKKDALERAASIRRKGNLARITLERQDYGSWWVVWSAGKKK